jgi:uncharacterized membrane protein
MATVNAVLMEQARGNLKGKWGIAALGTIIYLIVSVLIGCIPVAGYIIQLVFGGALYFGWTLFALTIARGKEPKLELLFSGFSYILNTFLTYLLMVIFTFLWLLLLIIPGIIAGFSYAMTFFILADNPSIKALDAITLSKKMMMGYKWKLFCLYCRFIGWALLGILSIGIGFIWILPYIKTAEAHFYDDLKAQQQPGTIVPPVINHDDVTDFTK